MENWTEKEWNIFFSIYENIERQGPGDPASTKKAFAAFTDLPKKPRIIDIGCGTGQQTLDLAKISSGEVWGGDNHQPFLDILNKKAKEQPLINEIKTVKIDICALDIPEKHFDVIWAEGSIYFYGYQNALKNWDAFFRDKKRFVFSEPNWFTTKRPAAVQAIWDKEYPQITSIAETIKNIRELGYEIMEHFKLPDSAWSENYYSSLKKISEKYLAENKDSASVRIVTASIFKEIADFEKFSKYYGYTFYICRK